MKRILMTLMVLVLALGTLGAGASALFTDTETSTGNTMTAGTLDIVMGSWTATLADMKPGDTQTETVSITNNGSLPATSVDIVFGITDSEPTADTEPEYVAEGDPAPGVQNPDNTVGKNDISDRLTFDYIVEAGPNGVIDSTIVGGVLPDDIDLRALGKVFAGVITLEDLNPLGARPGTTTWDLDATLGALAKSDAAPGGDDEWTLGFGYTFTDGGAAVDNKYQGDQASLDYTVNVTQ